jgi:60 kDa SS-A/Ro ribonucleoprotein
MAFSHELRKINMSRQQRLDDVIKHCQGMPFGGTDCSLPMLWALKNKVEADAFVIYTDNETWAGSIHPVQALEEYRRKMDIPAKLVVVGLASNEFSIADPTDGGMMDVVGFDTAAPAIIGDFIANR